VRVHFDLGLPTGVVVANPIPVAHEMPADTYERALAAALEAHEQAGVQGRDVTPFLLERMRALTGGTSVAVNRALLAHNAAVAADLAVALAADASRERPGA
jgi:pseudouridine-5'-phosphate glycosidase